LAEPDSAAAPATGPESPPETPAAASTEAPPEVKTETPAATVSVTEPAAESDDTGPTTEEQNQWTDGERRLYGALLKEREKRKEFRDENKDLRARIERIESARPPEGGTPNAPNAPSATPATAPNAAVELSDCETFEAVDARAMQAVRMETTAMRLQRTLASQGREAVATTLSSNGIKEVAGVPVTEATDEQLNDFLLNVYQGARQTILSVDPRKRFLVEQAQAFAEAVQILPELKDPKSPRAQKFAGLVHANPWLRQTGPRWPELTAKYIIGDEAISKPAPGGTPKSNGHSPQSIPVPVKPVLPQAPGAPRNSPAALPKPDEYEQAAAAVRNGSATLDDIKLMARAASRSSAAR
jgi:hypothetical protein